MKFKNGFFIFLSFLLAFCFSPSSPEVQFKELSAQFAQEYASLDIPYFGFEYRDNFKQIPSLEKLAKQQKIIENYLSKLQNIDYQKLTKSSQVHFSHLEYELKFHLERFALEKQFKEAKIETVPEGGLSKIPQTKAWYRYYAKRYTGLDLSPEELESFGNQEVKRCQNEIKKIQKELGFENDSAGFYQHLNTNDFYLTDKELIFKAYQQIDQTVRKNLPKFFLTTDISEVGIMTWQNAGPQTPPGYYNPASQNAYGKGVFHFNFYNEKHNKRVLDWLYMHEAIPGHHYQFDLRQRIKGEPAFKSLFMYPGNFEGWGAYVEYLGEDLGLYQNPYTRLGKWEWDLVRSLRVVLDVGIHYQGWTKAEALAFWYKNIPNQNEIAEREVNRCINWNGQVLSYKVGAWKIQQMLEKRKQKEGKKFDIRKFHADYLNFGQMPLAVIERFILVN